MRLQRTEEATTMCAAARTPHVAQASARTPSKPRRRSNEAQVWPPLRPESAGPEGELRHCPHHDSRHCHCEPRDHRPGRRGFAHAQVPAYYLTRTAAGGAMCEDQRLFHNALHRWRWMASEGDDLLDEDEREATQTRLTGFAAARAELAHRRSQVKREYLLLVRLAGEPEEPVFEDEVMQLLDQVRYALDSYHDALVEFYERRRRREQVYPPKR